jgi:probable H4MPT-linked C1 transfer pathway protein
MNEQQTLGWDLGGAHLKAALLDANGRALRVFQQPCPLWRGLDRLQAAVDAVMSALTAPPQRHAITMTGELADIFPSRNDGVQQLTQSLSAYLGGADMQVYAGAAGFVAASEADTHGAEIASANWHASAHFLAATAGEGIFMDIGSTTSDVVMLRQSRVLEAGYTDAERLRSDTLIYTGVVRTPVMAVAQRLPFGGEWQGLAAEHFATMADVFRLTGELAEEYDMADTADGAGKSMAESARRLARMLGHDLDDAPMLAWRQVANAARSQQLHLLQSALERQISRTLPEPEAPLIGAGAGHFLVRALAARLGRPYRDAASYIDAADEIAAWAGVCLPAYAVAWLARREAVWH